MSRAEVERTIASGRPVSLNAAQLADTDLTGLVLAHADLSYADLEGAQLDRADLRGARLWPTSLAPTCVGLGWPAPF